MQYENFEERMSQCVEIAEEHERELFGDAVTLPDDEFDIVFSRMKHEDKVESLKVLRALKTRGLGISLV